VPSKAHVGRLLGDQLRNYPFKLWCNARLAVSPASGFADIFSDIT
jgi:hypothetical protein